MTIFRAVQKLYALRDSRCIFSKKDKKEISLNQLPLFFLAKGKTNKMTRLLIMPNGGLGFSKHTKLPERQIMCYTGTKSLERSWKMEYKLPKEGIEVQLRTFQGAPFSFRACTKYQFELGKTSSSKS